MKRFIRWLRGIVVETKVGNNRVRLYLDGWVEVSDGRSRDSLPLCLVSPELQKLLSDAKGSSNP